MGGDEAARAAGRGVGRSEDRRQHAARRASSMSPPNSFTDQMLSVEQMIPLSGRNHSRARIAAAEALGGAGRTAPERTRCRGQGARRVLPPGAGTTPAGTQSRQRIVAHADASKSAARDWKSAIKGRPTCWSRRTKSIRHRRSAARFVAGRFRGRDAAQGADESRSICAARQAGGRATARAAHFSVEQLRGLLLAATVPKCAVAEAGRRRGQGEARTGETRVDSRSRP